MKQKSPPERTFPPILKMRKRDIAEAKRLFRGLLDTQARGLAAGYIVYVERMHPDWPKPSEWDFPGTLEECKAVVDLVPRTHKNISVFQRAGECQPLAYAAGLTSPAVTLVAAWTKAGRPRDPQILLDEIHAIYAEERRSR